MRRLIAFLGALVALAAFVPLTACTECKTGVMRCSGARAQLCDKNGDWRTVADCARVKPADGSAAVFKCCCDDAGRCACIKGDGGKQ